MSLTVTLHPGDVFVSREGFTVRVMTEDETRAMYDRVGQAITAMQARSDAPRSTPTPTTGEGT